MDKFPVDPQAFLALVTSPLFMGVFLSWVFDHVPQVRDPKVADWKKLGLVALLCYVWAIFSSIVTLGHIPSNINEIYAVFLLGLGVLFSNQASYALVEKIPALRDFILQLFGRPAVITTVSSSNGITVTSAQATVVDGAAG